ncbi:hypothetical protein Bhyg_01949 [Pseudolycoriella hygida]|uniref:Uncharacterized protein n=1 Tax=Pseudolycoriella hygida TaxID=35572 RepID=A0A9Q0S834_9DIPT|nr:hypothetical protein Bhyg_01949 [Pseudolycoriella hygida]
MEIDSAICDLPPMSKIKYTKIYNDFQMWFKKLGKPPITETVVLRYFSELAEKSKPSTLWTYYSMLKATLKLNDKVDIGAFYGLLRFLKTKSSGYEPVKAKMFTEEEIKRFITEVPDDKWLDLKVICIFSVCGGINTKKLISVSVDHVKQYDNSFLVTLPKTQTGPQRTFAITGTLSFSKTSKIGPSITSLSTVNLAVNGNRYAVSDHVCSLRCGQVKCASEENVNDVYHAFNILRSSEYSVEDVTPVLFKSKPTCRWIVAYKHDTEPIHYSNTDENFEEITRSIPNNVKAIENYVRVRNVQSSAAYVVVYGVNCRCEKRNVNVPSIGENDSLDDLECSIDGIKCEPEDPTYGFEAQMNVIKCEPEDPLYQM